MIREISYRRALIAAICFHILIGFMLFFESSTRQPALIKEAKNVVGEPTPLDTGAKANPEIVKAVSVDQSEVQKTVSRLKQERALEIKKEQAKQQALVKQADMARKERVLEQERLQKLKDESAKIALLRKKEIEEEQKRLKQLALEKELESKRLDELKKQQQALEKKREQEAIKLAQMKKKQELQDSLAEKLRAEKAQEQRLNEARESAARQAAENNAAEQARIASEVDKYKALIINAISQRWILPENVDSSLSSQFRIRLAPDGSVLEVSLTRSSGDPLLDRSAQTAIYKASPLPVPGDAPTFNIFRDISLTVRPENVRG